MAPGCGTARMRSAIASDHANSGELLSLTVCPPTPRRRKRQMGPASGSSPSRSAFKHSLMLVHAVQLVGGVVDVQRGRALADAEEVADFPGGLSFHRPAEGLELARRQAKALRAELGDGVRMRKAASCACTANSCRSATIRVSSTAVRRNGLVAIDAQEEVALPPACAAPSRCRSDSRSAPGTSHISPDAMLRVRRLIPDDRHALPLAVLHHRIAPILLRGSSKMSCESHAACCRR